MLCVLRSETVLLKRDPEASRKKCMDTIPCAFSCNWRLVVATKYGNNLNASNGISISLIVPMNLSIYLYPMI